MIRGSQLIEADPCHSVVLLVSLAGAGQNYGARKRRRGGSIVLLFKNYANREDFGCGRRPLYEEHHRKFPELPLRGKGVFAQHRRRLS